MTPSVAYGSAPAPSALTSYIASICTSTSFTHPAHLHQLAAQVLHNLQYQHDWRDLIVHSHAARRSHEPKANPANREWSGDDNADLDTRTQDTAGAPADPSWNPAAGLLPRPLVSGIPPRRIYTHPDLQQELIKKGLREEDLPEERVWVCPSHIRERWSLKMFAEVFDGLPEAGSEGGRGREEAIQEDGEIEERKPWDLVKRMLLATVEDDSTVVYYVVHDGIVKPRQN